MKKIKIKSFTNHQDCLNYLKDNFRDKPRIRGIYIEATDKKIRPGMGLLFSRLEKHSLPKTPRTKKLNDFYGKYIKYILVIPLMEYYDDRFICDSELSYLETKLIELIEEKSKKENLANKFYEEGDLHKTQIEELNKNKLFKKIRRWINKNWKTEFYGK